VTSPDQARDEMVCDRCKRRHGVVWFAPSDVWNAVMREGDRGKPDEFSFCCPICFIQLADERGIKSTGWCVSPEEPKSEARLRVVLKEHDEAVKSEAEIRRQHTVVMDRIKGTGLSDGYTEWRDEEYRQWDQHLERTVECPACGFTFGAAHTVHKVGGYTCPNCAEEELKARLLRAEEALREIADGRTARHHCFPKCSLLLGAQKLASAYFAGEEQK
jgi:hypothetical protein